MTSLQCFRSFKKLLLRPKSQRLAFNQTGCSDESAPTGAAFFFRAFLAAAATLAKPMLINANDDGSGTASVESWNPKLGAEIAV